jgi:outer membrane protein OmpA-like peptidoglycan-associated protein
LAWLLAVGAPAWAQHGEYVLSGTVYGKKGGKSRPEKDACIALYEADALPGRPTLYESPSSKYLIFSGYDGHFELVLDSRKHYLLLVAKEGYGLESFSFTPKEGLVGKAVAIEVTLQEGASVVFSQQYVDAATKLPLEGVQVKMKEDGTDDIRVATTDAKGRCYFLFGQQEARGTLQAYKKGYLLEAPEEFAAGAAGRGGSVSRELEPIRIGEWVRMREFAFGINSHELQEAGMAELNGLLRLMLDNPGIRVEIASHTDARGDDTYNLLLSQKRAESAVAYLTARGVSPSRLRPRGYGEEQLLNACANGVRCDNEKHEENRRMEYQVYEIVE